VLFLEADSTSLLGCSIPVPGSASRQLGLVLCPLPNNSQYDLARSPRAVFSSGDILRK
jgi:hypothetical protein